MHTPGYRRMKGRVEYFRFQGPLTLKEIKFGIYLPAEYERQQARRFPILYFLHGLNEDYTSNIYPVAAAIETSMAAGLLPPVIIVTPDGHTNSMWVDSKDGRKPAETQVIKEIIPFVEKAFRIMPGRSNRIIGGFSMGGYGALRYALKYPEYFGACISLDGAIHTLRTFSAIRKDIFIENFGGDEQYFMSHCVYQIAKQNIEKVRDKVSFFIGVGVLATFNRRFKRHLQDFGVAMGPEHYFETGCDHNVTCILDCWGEALFAKIGHCLCDANTETGSKERF